MNIAEERRLTSYVIRYLDSRECLLLPFLLEQELILFKKKYSCTIERELRAEIQKSFGEIRVITRCLEPTEICTSHQKHNFWSLLATWRRIRELKRLNAEPPTNETTKVNSKNLWYICSGLLGKEAFMISGATPNSTLWIWPWKLR